MSALKRTLGPCGLSADGAICARPRITANSTKLMILRIRIAPRTECSEKLRPEGIQGRTGIRGHREGSSPPAATRSDAQKQETLSASASVAQAPAPVKDASTPQQTSCRV